MERTKRKRYRDTWGSASAGGKIFIVGRDGTTVVVKSGPNFTVLTTNRLDEGIDASPVIVGDKLFLRSKQHLYCISEERLLSRIGDD
jgi:outer membrane protein assembly factor BamB